MHTELVDLQRDGEPLLLGLRIYIISGAGIGRFDKQGEGLPLIGLAGVEMSLISHRGVVKRKAEVEEVAHFKHPSGELYDQTLLTVKDVNFGKYTPITIGPYPPAGTELEMLSYRVDRENKLRFMDYPLRHRDCQVLGFDAETFVSDSTCVAATDAFSILGAPIFTKEDATLVAFYYGVADDGISKGGAMLPELQLYMRRKLAVDEHSKMASLWGRIKAAD